MSFRWTETLNEPLATLARGRSWARVEEAPQGGWLFLPETASGKVAWLHAPDGGSTLRLLDPLEDVGLPHMRAAVSRWLTMGHPMRLLAWRVGRRAVFRVATPDGSRICKLYRKDRETLLRWRALPGEPHGTWRVPRLIDWEPEHLLLSIEDCPGSSLNTLWLAGDGEPRHGDRIADLLSWLASLPVSAELPRYGVDHEVELLGRRLESFERMLRDPPRSAPGLTARVVQALREEPARRETTCHRDLHDKQILLDGAQGALIDLDLLAAGPPALDPGNILAHLRLRDLQGARLPWKEIARRIVADAVPARGIRNSLHRWTASTLLRLSLIYARRRRPEGLLERLLASTEQALDRDGEWAGIL